VVGSCEHGNEPSDSIIRGEFPDKLNDYQLLKKRAPSSVPNFLALLSLRYSKYSTLSSYPSFL
jgi:hypothetical protein